MLGQPLFTPVLGHPEFLDAFLQELLASQAVERLPDLPPSSDMGPEELPDSSNIDTAPPVTAGAPEELPVGPAIELIDVLPQTVGSGPSGVVLEDDAFSFARPGSTDDGGTTKGGGGGGKPSGGGDDGDGSGETLLSSYTSGGNAKTSYNIQVNFVDGGWTAELQQVFINAADYLSSIVLGDVSDERVPLYGRVDDLAIDASIIEIDGAGGVLGGAAVFASRVGSELPAASIMQFDVADVGAALTDGYLTHIVIHEMVHAMGFGGKWADMDLVQTFVEDGQDVLRFIGANATAEYKKLAVSENDLYRDNGVLIEMDGGSGTAGAHWDDTTFTDLLMTGYIDTAAPGTPELSMMSIAALQDMGYETTYGLSLDGLIG